MEDGDIFVDSLKDGDLKTLKDNLSRWGDHPRQAVGVDRPWVCSSKVLCFPNLPTFTVNGKKIREQDFKQKGAKIHQP